VKYKKKSDYNYLFFLHQTQMIIIFKMDKITKWKTFNIKIEKSLQSKGLINIKYKETL